MTLPAPPPVLPARPQLFELKPGSRLVRFYNPAHGPWDERRHYGPLPNSRFDHHLPPLGRSPDRSVWYSATSLVGAIAEAFGNLHVVDQKSGRRICQVRLRSPIPVLDLAGVKARAFGLDQRIGASLEYPRCQEWARAFYEHYRDLRGLRWRGRQAGSLCLLLNDRAVMSSFDVIEDRDIADPVMWPRISRAAQDAFLQIVAV